MEATNKGSVLRANLLPMTGQYARTLQRLVPMHRKLCSFNHGRDHYELPGPTELHCLQRWEPSLGSSSTGGYRGAEECSLAHGESPKQELGRVRDARCSQTRFRLYGL